MTSVGLLPIGSCMMRTGALLLAVLAAATLPSAGSPRAAGPAAAAGCRDRIAGCRELIDSGSHSCDEHFCDDCGNQRHRCDATCGFCTGDTGASRAAATAAQLAAVASRSRTTAPPVMPPVVSCYTTRLNEPTIRDHRCEGAVAGANSCFINMAVRLAGCCFSPGTAPPGRAAFECSEEQDGRVCHARACNTPVPMTSVVLPPSGKALSGTRAFSVAAGANSIVGTYRDPNHPAGYRYVDISADGVVTVSGNDHSASGAEWTLAGRVVNATSVLIDFTPRSATVGIVIARFVDGSQLVFPDGNMWSKQPGVPAPRGGSSGFSRNTSDVMATAKVEPVVDASPLGTSGSSSSSFLSRAAMFAVGTLITRHLVAQWCRRRRARNATTMLPMKVESHVH